MSGYDPAGTPGVPGAPGDVLVRTVAGRQGDVVLTVADIVGASAAADVAAALALKLDVPAYRFDVTHYGAVAGTDCTAAIRAAVEAAIAYARDPATDAYAEVYFPTWGPWNVSGAFSTLDACFAMIPLRRIPKTERKVTLAFVGPSDIAVDPIYNQTVKQTGGAVIVSSVTGFAYDPVAGLPSVIGGPDYDKAVVPGGAVNFSNMHLVSKGVRVRQPDNPCLCSWNLGGLAGASGNFHADTDVVTGQAEFGGAGGGVMTQPTHPTGVGVMFPQQNNSADVTAELVSSFGYYCGVVMGEHARVERLIAFRNRQQIGLTPTAGGHASRIEHSAVEWANYILAGWSPVTGVMSLPAGSVVGPVQYTLDNEDNDGSGGDWAVTTAHILDANDILFGRLAVLHAVENIGPVTTPFTIVGGTNLIIDYINTIPAPPAPPAWIPLALLNGWVDFGGDYGAPAYRKHPDGRVELRGIVKDGTAPGGPATPICVLPAGYRPGTQVIRVSATGTNVLATVEVEGLNTVESPPHIGAVWHDTAANGLLILDGITFYAEG